MHPYPTTHPHPIGVLVILAMPVKNKFDITLVNHGYVSIKLLQMWPGLGGPILLKYRQL